MIEQLRVKLNEARKTHNNITVSAYSLMISELQTNEKLAEKDPRKQSEQKVLQKLYDQLIEMCDSFAKANNHEVASEANEKARIVSQYLIQPLSQTEIIQIIQKKYEEGLTTFQQLIKVILSENKDRTNGGVVKPLIEEYLRGKV